MSRNFSRWTGVKNCGTDTYHWPNPFFYDSNRDKIDVLPDDSSVGSRPPQSYNDPINIMKWFLAERFNLIDTQLVESPTAPVDVGSVE